MPKVTHIRADDSRIRFRDGRKGPLYVEPRLTRRSALQSLGQVVYAIRTPDGLIKIGSTGDLDNRLRHHKSQVGSHELLCYQPSELDDERALHTRFRPHRARGREWYHPAPEILDWINTNRQHLGLEPVAP